MMKSKLRRQLVFEHYEAEIRVERIGRHGSEMFYLWTSILPSESPFPQVEQVPLTESELLLRLDLHEEHFGAFDSADRLAISQLFEKAT